MMEKAERGLLTSTPADPKKTGTFTKQPKRLSDIPAPPFAIVKKTQMIDMIIEAIQAMALPRKGASYQAIKKWIVANKLPESSTFNRLLKKAVLKGIEAGILVRPHHSINSHGATGSFALAKKVNKSPKKAFKKAPEKAAVQSSKAAAVKPLKTDPVKPLKKDTVKTLKKDPVKTLKKDHVKTLKKDPVKTLKKDPVKTLKKDPVKTLKKDPAKSVKKGPVKSPKKVAEKSSKEAVTKSPKKAVKKFPKGKTHEKEKNTLANEPLKGAANKGTESSPVLPYDMPVKENCLILSFSESEEESPKRKEQPSEAASSGKARIAKVNKQENAIKEKESAAMSSYSSNPAVNKAAKKNVAEKESSQVKRGKELEDKRTAKQANSKAASASKVVDVVKNKAEDQIAEGKSRSARNKKLYASKNTSKLERKDLSDTELDVNIHRPKSLKSYSSDTELEISKRRKPKEMPKSRKLAKVKTAEDIISAKKTRKGVDADADTDERDSDDSDKEPPPKPQNQTKMRKGR